MAREPPPPVLDSARVLAYAFVDDIPFRRAGSLIVNGQLVEHVPRLAICRNLGEDIGPMLFHCDEEWKSVGTTGAKTVDDAKAAAERNYPGVMSRWVDVETSVEDALKYYDEQTGSLKCSFCGKRPFEVEGMAEGKGVAICKACIEDFHNVLQTPSSDSEESAV
jgi:hypothetical protein